MSIDINAQGTPNPDRIRDGDLPIDLTRPNRRNIRAQTAAVEQRRLERAETQRAAEASAKSNETTKSAHKEEKSDSIELSVAARALSAPREDPRERAQRIHELRREIEQGTFHTHARAEKSARTILGDA
jgi:anti-sigma28 factor (negative regulator of flagellin synthesis)